MWLYRQSGCRCFNTQPPEGGCLSFLIGIQSIDCFNTQPPEGGCGVNYYTPKGQKVSTHSHPKVAADQALGLFQGAVVSTHSHPKVAAHSVANQIITVAVFQHTATRRWLHLIVRSSVILVAVSTHSHPKVAAIMNIAFF